MQQLILQSDRLDLQQSHIKRLINAGDVTTSHATHVVVGIDWGSTSVVSIMGSNEDGPNSKDNKVSAMILRILFREFTFERFLHLEKSQRKVYSYSFILLLLLRNYDLTIV